MRVEVVDDNAALRAVACLEIELAAEFELVGQAADGFEAIEVATAQHPDVIILDLEMPNMGGMDALPQLVQIVPDAMIVVYTSRDCDDSRATAARLGAWAYMLKQRTPIRDVLAALPRS